MRSSPPQPRKPQTLNSPVQSLSYTWIGDTSRMTAIMMSWPWRWWVCDGVHWEWWRWWCLIADEAKRGLGPGLPQCYTESSAKNGRFGAGEHSDQRAKQQAAAPSGTPTGTHKAQCTWWWWWWFCNKHHQWLLLELRALELLIYIKLISGAGICIFLISSFYFSCCNLFLRGKQSFIQSAKVESFLRLFQIVTEIKVLKVVGSQGTFHMEFAFFFFFPCDYIRELFCSVCLVHDVHEMSGSVLSKIKLLCLWLQCAKEYYEQALMQELKKNQELQEYIRLLENRVHNPGKECRLDKQVYTSHRIARLNSY